MEGTRGDKPPHPFHQRCPKYECGQLHVPGLPAVTQPVDSQAKLGEWGNALVRETKTHVCMSAYCKLPGL